MSKGGQHPDASYVSLPDSISMLPLELSLATAYNLKQKVRGNAVRKTFAIAQGKRKGEAELTCTPNADATLLEAEGNAFGLWLLENGSTSFLRGLQEVLREAEIDKKVGLGY